MAIDEHVRFLRSGLYRVRLLYHDHVDIADERDIQGRIVFSSAPFDVLIRPLSIAPSRQELRSAEDVGLPKLKKGPKARVAELRKAIATLQRKELSLGELADDRAERLRELVEAPAHPRDPPRELKPPGRAAGATLLG